MGGGEDYGDEEREIERQIKRHRHERCLPQRRIIFDVQIHRKPLTALLLAPLHWKMLGFCSINLHACTEHKAITFRKVS